MGVALVVDGRTRRQQLAGRLLDLGHHGADHARFGLVVGGALEHARKASADRQQQGRVVAQLRGQRGIEFFQVLGETPEQGELLLDRYVFVQRLLQPGHQPGNGRGASARLERMDLDPMPAAQTFQQSQSGQQTGKGFPLVEGPGQPGCNTQVLGLGTKQRFAVFQDFQPVGLAVLMERERLAQLIFQRLVFAGKTHILTRKDIL